MENKERQREGLAHIDREIRNECRSLWGATEHPSGGSEWVLRHAAHLFSPAVYEQTRRTKGDAWLNQHYPDWVMAQEDSCKVNNGEGEGGGCHANVSEHQEPAAMVVAEVSACPSENNPRSANEKAHESEAGSVHLAVVHQAPLNGSVTTNCLLPDIAPIFRHSMPLANPRTGRAYSSEETEQLIQQQVAELVWLHRAGHRIKIDSPAYRNMLKEEVLDLGLAEQFAKEPWTVSHKQKLLMVPEQLQFELRLFRTKAVADKFRAADTSVERDRARLQRSTAGDKRIDVDTWCRLLLCERLMGKGNTRAILAFYLVMTGQSLDRSNATRTLKKVHAWLERA